MVCSYCGDSPQCHHSTVSMSPQYQYSIDDITTIPVHHNISIVQWWCCHNFNPELYTGFHVPIQQLNTQHCTNNKQTQKHNLYLSEAPTRSAPTFLDVLLQFVNRRGVAQYAVCTGAICNRAADEHWCDNNFRFGGTSHSLTHSQIALWLDLLAWLGMYIWKQINTGSRHEYIRF